MYVEPDSISEKIRQFNGDVAEPKLETPSEIKQNNTERKPDIAWLNNFLNGVKTTKQVLQELNNQAIADLLCEEIMAPKADTEIDPIFIDDNDIFAKDDLANGNKEFIKNLLGKSNYNSILISSDEEEDDRQDLLQTDLLNKDLVGADAKTEYDIPSFDKPTFKSEPLFDVVPKEEIDLPTIDPTISVTNENGDNDLIYVKYIHLPPVNPPQLIHPRDRYRKKVEQLRDKKRAKKRAIQTLIKKKEKSH